MNLFEDMRAHVVRVVEGLAADGKLPAGLDTARLSVEPPREAEHGDVTTNAAMVLSRQASMKPRDLAALLVERLESLESVRQVEVAGPGFINLRLADSVWYAQLTHILSAGPAFGDSGMGRGRRINVESCRPPHRPCTSATVARGIRRRPGGAVGKGRV